MATLAKLLLSLIALFVFFEIGARLLPAPSQPSRVSADTSPTEMNAVAPNEAALIPDEVLAENSHVLLSGRPFADAIAKSLTASPGAIVCPDMDRVRLVFDLYADAWSEGFNDMATHGASRMMNGQPSSSPDPNDYGCLLLKPGTHVKVDMVMGVPIVTATIGTAKIRGVTLAAMIASNPASGQIVSPVLSSQ